MPVSPYGVSKHAVELYLSCFKAMYGLHYVALRYANVYGPRQNPHGEAGVVAIFAERLLKGQECTINGDGGQTRDFVFSGDVVAANVRALETTYCGGVNIGTGVEADVNRIYALLARHVGTDRLALYAAGKPGEQRRSVLANAKAREVLGWTPAQDLDGGIAATIAWYRSRRS
jgi:UDP-glucose 4-epimerase